MGIRRGSILTPIIADGLVFNMDAANRASTIPSTSTDKTFNTVDTAISGSFINDTIYDSSTITPSYAFDGTTDYIVVNNLNNIFEFERTDAFSISAWVKRNSSKNQMIVSKRLSSGNLTGYSLRITNSTNKLQVQLRSAGSNRLIVDGSTALDTNWNHVVLTYDGSSNISGLNIYLNGSNDNGLKTGTLSLSILNSAEFNIGAENNNDDFFDGNIGPVHLYNRALSANEVLHNYNALKGRFGL